MIPIEDREKDLQLIGFKVDSKLFGVNILTIREILRDPVIEIIQNAPEFIEGSVRIRGEFIPIINLRKRFGNDSSEIKGGPIWILVTKVADFVFGFWVDSVTRIIKVDEQSILPAPDLVLTGIRSQYIQGVCNSELGMLVVLDLKRILGTDEIEKISKTIAKIV